ncbi:hypothetical protein [Natrinema sp. CGMCC1.2065]|uniref:hypothetical protein n=1 Tax=Natrinema sp. CGMCC1.2065 TaxID=3445767 RepID=UPI003F4A7614
MACETKAADLFLEGEWFESFQCWITAGGDPTLQMLMPSVIWGVILVAFFVVGSSPLIPVVLSIILAGVIFVAFPAGALQIVVMTMLTVLSVGGLVLTWRMGR